MGRGLLLAVLGQSRLLGKERSRYSASHHRDRPGLPQGHQAQRPRRALTRWQGQWGAHSCLVTSGFCTGPEAPNRSSSHTEGHWAAPCSTPISLSWGYHTQPSPGRARLLPPSPSVSASTLESRKFQATAHPSSLRNHSPTTLT